MGGTRDSADLVCKQQDGEETKTKTKTFQLSEAKKSHNENQFKLMDFLSLT